jgi:hypothetical protein
MPQSLRSKIESSSVYFLRITLRFCEYRHYTAAIGRMADNLEEIWMGIVLP